MDRLKLVKKITSLADIPFSEGEIFLEMFARKISDELTSGQKIDIPGLGPVSYNKAESGASSVAFHTDSGELQIYLPEEQGVISYSRYNLSIGKPVLPVSGKSDNLNFVFHPHENLHSLESKADRIFSSVMPSSDQIIIDDYDISGLDEFNTEKDNEADVSSSLISEDNIFGEDSDNIFDELVDSTLDEINEITFDDEEPALPSPEDKADDFFRKLEEIESSADKEVSSSEDLSGITIDDLSENAFGEVENVEIEMEDIEDKIDIVPEESTIKDEDIPSVEGIIIPEIIDSGTHDAEVWIEQLNEDDDPLSPELKEAVAHDMAVWQAHLKEDEEPLTPEEAESVAHDIAIWEKHLQEDEEPLAKEEIETFSKIITDEEESVVDQDPDILTIQTEDESLTEEEEWIQLKKKEIISYPDPVELDEELLTEEETDSDSLSYLVKETESTREETQVFGKEFSSEDSETDKYRLSDLVEEIENIQDKIEFIDEIEVLENTGSDKLSLSDLIEEAEDIQDNTEISDEDVLLKDNETEKYVFSDFVTDIEDIHEDIELSDVKLPPEDIINDDIKISSIEEELPSGLEEIPGDNILHEFDKEEIMELDIPDEPVSAEELTDIEDAENSFGRLAEEIKNEKNSGQPESTEEDVSIIRLIDNSQKPAAGEDDKLTAEKSYQRVKSLTREFFSLTDLEQQEKMLTWEFGGSDQMDTDIKSATREFDDITPASDNDGFTFVKSKKSTMEWTPGSLPDMNEITPFNDDEVTEEIELNLEDNIFMSGPPTETDIEEKKPESKVYSRESIKEVKKQKKRIPPKEEKFKQKREQKKSSSFIIVAGILSFITIAVIIYYALFIGSAVPEKRTEKPLMIERNDRVPVLIGEITPEIIKETSTETEASGNETAADAVTESPEVSEGEMVKVEDGIFRRNNVYYVQVSSWQTKSKADREAERYRRSGYKAELQTTNLRSGLWYKILVGEFSSSEEAVKYLKN
jgi:hypothetical protein